MDAGHTTVWTGTEVIVWGGTIVGEVPAGDGAAYNPSTDTWRLLPSAPDGVEWSSVSVWTGKEAVVMNCTGLGKWNAAAYDPAADRWRAISNPFDADCDTNATPLWTGDAIVLATDRMVRSDEAVDRWSTIAIGSPAAVVGIPSSDGSVSTFVNLPTEIETSAQLLDSTGESIADLPAFPGDPSLFGDQIGAYGVWAGDEAVFWIFAADSANGWPEQVWALNPRTRAWRQLDTDTAFPGHAHSGVVVADDVLLMWGTPGVDLNGRGITPHSNGVAFRVGVVPSD